MNVFELAMSDEATREWLVRPLQRPDSPEYEAIAKQVLYSVVQHTDGSRCLQLPAGVKQIDLSPSMAAGLAELLVGPIRRTDPGPAVDRAPAGFPGPAIMVLNFHATGKVSIDQWFGNRWNASYVSAPVEELMRRTLPKALKECEDFAVRGITGYWDAPGSEVTK